jgi:UDP-N-acetylglucosamine diphosphorylase/glucosamine-1-phosphate N-acetyltransferase
LALVAVIFEDESVTGFRPLAWSQPVCELRCGLLNLRERITHLTGSAPHLLVREFLQELAVAHGHPVGADALTRRLKADDRLLLVNGRFGHRWDRLVEVVREAGQRDIAWRDDCGWLALAAGGSSAAALLASWVQWQSAAAESGCWHRTDRRPPVWQPTPPAAATARDGSWRRIWDLMAAAAVAIGDDLARLNAHLPARTIWGAIAADAAATRWDEAVTLQSWREASPPHIHVKNREAVWVGPGCDLAPGLSIDASHGPVILGRDVRVMPHCYLEGPLYVGSGSLIKAGASIYGETSLGAVNRVAGEIAESTFLDFTNKQHDGFIGHAYLGSWCNLGAMTTCSDLKNNYGPIRVDLGDGPQDSGRRFLGLLMGEHGKTAIGTLFNTGTSVGFAANVFGAGFPAKSLPCFTWGNGGADAEAPPPARQDPERALATAATVLARRGCRLDPGHAAIFRALAG